MLLNEGFWGLYTANMQQPYLDPKRALLCVETRNTTYRLLRLV